MGPKRPYANRAEAGAVLASTLTGLEGMRCVVAALPRGGVPVAVPIARELDAPLTLSFVRKLTLARAPELAVGAVDEDAHIMMDAATLGELGASMDEVVEARTRAAREIARLQLSFPVPPLERFVPDASVVLVDDGPATGLTLRLAIAHARRHGALEVIVAVPCSSVLAASRLRREANRFICPWVDPDFFAVGRHYRDFHPLLDAELLAQLGSAQKAPGSAT